jgi:hypothetical protein
VIFPLERSSLRSLCWKMASRSLSWNGGRNSEGALAVKTAVRAENVAVGVKPQEIPKRLYGDHSAGHSILLWHGLLEKHLQRLPGTST